MFTDSQIESTIDIVIGQLYGQPETSPLAADVIRHLGGIEPREAQHALDWPPTRRAFFVALGKGLSV
jgi:hypothetical protein